MHSPTRQTRAPNRARGQPDETGTIVIGVSQTQRQLRREACLAAATDGEQVHRVMREADAQRRTLVLVLVPAPDEGRRGGRGTGEDGRFVVEERPPLLEVICS